MLQTSTDYEFQRDQINVNLQNTVVLSPQLLDCKPIGLVPALTLFSSPSYL